MSANRRSSPWWMAFGCRWGGRPPVGFRVGFAVLQLLVSISSLCFPRNHWWTRKCIKPRFSQSGFCLWVATNRSMRSHSIRRFGSLRQAAAAKPWTKARARRSFAWRVSYRSLAGWLCLTGFANSRLIIKNLRSGLAKHNHCNPFILHSPSRELRRWSVLRLSDSFWKSNLEVPSINVKGVPICSHLWSHLPWYISPTKWRVTCNLAFFLSLLAKGSIGHQSQVLSMNPRQRSPKSDQPNMVTWLYNSDRRPGWIWILGPLVVPLEVYLEWLYHGIILKLRHASW